MSQTSAKQPRIERIELTAFTIQIPNIGTDRADFGVFYQPGPGAAQTRFAVRIYAKDGLVGEYIPPRSRAKVIMAASEALAYGLIGQSALERERHYRSMRKKTKHVGEVGIGALDIALWDLAGKYHNAPIWQLLGGYRQKLPSYASTIHGDRETDGLATPEAFADFAEQCLELGYPAYKMHGWAEGDVAEESAIIRAVAERVGNKMLIMYDASGHLHTFAEAVQVGKVCDEYGLYWYEDPYADGGISIHGHRQLKQHIKTPLLITEHVRNPETTIDVLQQSATDFARVDPDYDGGITGSYKAALAAESLGMDVEVHSCGPAMRHLMAALRNSNYYEVNLVHPQAPNPWQLPVYADGYTDELDCIDSAGYVEVPQQPGLGVEYDWDYVRRHQVSQIVID